VLINFNTIYFLTILFWIIGLGLFYLPIQNPKRNLGILFFYIGITVLVVYIIGLWIDLERPPMRTLGETRLWYATFLSLIGILLYHFRKLLWVPLFSFPFAILFLTINFAHPEYFQKTLMPALQSPWFVPHVIVYIFAYSILFASTVTAFFGLLAIRKGEDATESIKIADSVVSIGFAFLTTGLIFGALWAKEAWGNYWTWDPKETWAFITWLLYLVYLHYRYQFKNAVKTPLVILTIAFGILMICWFGVNYLPSAKNSVHTYGMTQK